MTGRLVILTGYPCAGKSIVAHRLASQHGFACYDVDALRLAYFSQRYAPLQDTARGREKEASLWLLCNTAKRKWLMRGIDVVIESVAPQNAHREALLEAPWSVEGKPIVKYLIEIHADRLAIEERIRERPHNPDLIDRLDAGLWEKPIVSPSYTLLSYANNTEDDKRLLIASIDAHFGQR